MTNLERETLARQGKWAECPLCGCKEDEGHEQCFHCISCGYLQCCDYDEEYHSKRLSK